LPTGRFEALELPPDGRPGGPPPPPDGGAGGVSGLSFASSAQANFDEEPLQPGTPGLELDTEDKPRVEPAKKAKPKKEKAKAKGPLLTKNVIVTGAIILVVIFLGAGGLWFWEKKSAQDHAENQLRKAKEDAAKQLREVGPSHWERAAAIAQNILKTNPNDADALGILAQAHYAALLDEGTNGKSRKAAGSDAIAKARTAGI
jgi:hypothetical protein